MSFLADFTVELGAEIKLAAIFFFIFFSLNPPKLPHRFDGQNMTPTKFVLELFIIFFSPKFGDLVKKKKKKFARKCIFTGMGVCMCVCICMWGEIQVNFHLGGVF